MTMGKALMFVGSACRVVPLSDWVALSWTEVFLRLAEYGAGFWLGALIKRYITMLGRGTSIWNTLERVSVTYLVDLSGPEPPESQPLQPATHLSNQVLRVAESVLYPSRIQPASRPSSLRTPHLGSQNPPPQPRPVPPPFFPPFRSLRANYQLLSGGRRGQATLPRPRSSNSRLYPDYERSLCFFIPYLTRSASTSLSANGLPSNV